jgi:hypothetical protein
MFISLKCNFCTYPKNLIVECNLCHVKCFSCSEFIKIKCYKRHRCRLLEDLQNNNFNLPINQCLTTFIKSRSWLARSSIISKEEEKMYEILKSNNTNDKIILHEVEFDGLKFKKNLRFDFAILERLFSNKYSRIYDYNIIELIEVDGLSHKYNNDQNLRDNIKNSFCLKYNITLKRVINNKV